MDSRAKRSRCLGRMGLFLRQLSLALGHAATIDLALVQHRTISHITIWLARGSLLFGIQKDRLSHLVLHQILFSMAQTRHSIRRSLAASKSLMRRMLLALSAESADHQQIRSTLMHSPCKGMC